MEVNKIQEGLSIIKFILNNRVTMNFEDANKIGRQLDKIEKEASQPGYIITAKKHNL